MANVVYMFGINEVGVFCLFVCFFWLGFVVVVVAFICEGHF